MKKRKYTAMAMAGVPLILGGIGLFCLPENTAVQWNSAGEVQSAVSKYRAVMIGLGCGAFGGWYWYGKDCSTLAGIAKWLWSILDGVVGCMGIVILSVFLVMNL